jgi:O-antigen/teichoic acid export membrane protein
MGSIGVAVVALSAGYPVDTLWVIVVIGIAFMIHQIGYTAEATLKGLERMEFVSLGNILSKAFLMSVSILLLLLGYGVVVVACVSIGAALVNAFIQYRYLNRLQTVSFRIDWSLIEWMLKASFPYFMISVFIVLYRQVDVIVISLLANETVVGWYSAADQLFGTLLFLPTVFIAAVYPALSRMFVGESGSLHKLMQKSFEFMFIVSIPIGLGLIVISNQLVVLLFGSEFVNSGPVMAIIGVVLLFTYQNTLFGNFLISMDRQKVMIWVMALATLATIPLDLVLVPFTQNAYGNGAIGGALAYLITESLALIVIVSQLPKGMFAKESLLFSGKIILAGFVMVAGIWWLRDYFIALPILLGAVIYVAMILLLRALPKENIEVIKEVSQGVIARLKRDSTQAAN